ncbi:protein kinase domain-containing protein [Clostridium brassicae]|uniref:Protein kinase n=1 Tax=Clostridium brassicae TaxID=2999072 RepID=A0ABT4D7R9_9CLOT|nr:protein kinase [Clostridium brassicae]MCY6957723.1 protein kinase [Clostridium brassicae]
MFNQRDSIQKKCEIIKEVKKLNDLGISKIVDICFDNEKIYVIEEYVEGISLEKYVNKNGFLLKDDIYSIVLSLCDIVNYLNKLNEVITYGSLNPANIIITSNKKIVLSNLGMSQETRSIDNKYIVYSIDSDYTCIGEYDLKKHNQQNVYNIGTIMYFMATGKLPSIYLEPLIDENYSSYVDYSVKDIIQKCFRIDSKDRYVSIHELKKEIIINLLKDNKYTKSTVSSSLDTNTGIFEVDIRVEKKSRFKLKTILMGGAALTGVIVSAICNLIIRSKMLWN